jgi:hypothetical protein
MHGDWQIYFWMIIRSLKKSDRNFKKIPRIKWKWKYKINQNLSDKQKQF